MSEEREKFLSRWSRLKQEAREPQGPQAEGERPPAPDPAPAQAEAAPALPPVAELTPESDFRPFMDPRVDPAVRRDALKQLFRGAQFNVPDPFEAYSEDYTRSDPISPELLKTLNHARKLVFDETPKAAPESSDLENAAPKGSQDGAGRQDA